MTTTEKLEYDQLNHLTPSQAYEVTQTIPSALLIDIRSNMEFLFVGHPKGAIHIPWIDEPDWEVNPNFVKEIRQLILGGACEQGENSPPIILICRSGKRSTEAGHALLTAGLHNICHIDEGFEGDRDENYQRGTLGGWRFHGLPWEQC